MSAEHTPAGKGSGRQALLAKLHIAAKELKLDRATYGDVLLRVTGQDSARNLSDVQCEAVLSEFRRLGWKPKTFRPTSGKAQVRLVYSLWAQLQPHLQDKSDGALRAFVRRQTTSKVHPRGVAAPEFLGPREANLVIEGLKAWLARVQAGGGGGAP